MSTHVVAPSSPGPVWARASRGWLRERLVGVAAPVLLDADSLDRTLIGRDRSNKWNVGPHTPRRRVRSPHRPVSKRRPIRRRTRTRARDWLCRVAQGSSHGHRQSEWRVARHQCRHTSTRDGWRRRRARGTHRRNDCPRSRSLSKRPPSRRTCTLEPARGSLPTPRRRTSFARFD